MVFFTPKNAATFVGKFYTMTIFGHSAAIIIKPACKKNEQDAGSA
jgi:hypothetical protein